MVRLALPCPQSYKHTGLLLVFLDNIWWTNTRFVRVQPDIAQRTALVQEVPALIEYGLNFRHLFAT